jgi:phosphoadenosine phosphosulfate reductase
MIDGLELQRLNAEFENATPYTILEWAARTYGGKLVVVTSFQPTGIVTLHILSEIAPQTAVLTLDTELLFPETYALIDDLEKRLSLNLIRVRPVLTLDQQARQHGPALWECNPDACCQIRKVAPLGTALADYEAWLTGLRRDQSGRGLTPIISWDKQYQNVKICPFANWTKDMIWLYIQTHELPYNTLHDRGYPSIGCNTSVCTQPATTGADERSGRWVNHQKTECGIHVTQEENSL